VAYKIRELQEPRRLVRSVFVDSWPYWIINTVRHLGLDGALMSAATAVGVWWATGPGGLDLGLVDDDSADSSTRELLAHHVTRYYPTFLGLVVCFLVLRAGRRSVPGRRKNLTGAVYVSLTALQVLGIGVLPLTAALFVPGSAVQRLLPCLVGAVLACAARLAMYGGVRRRAATDAGFLPPRNVLWRPRAHRAVQRCTTVALGSQLAADRARASFEVARKEFAKYSSSTGLAWCLAAEVDYFLHVNALDQAEQLLEHGGAEAPQRQQTRSEPAAIAAQALFLQAVGDPSAALATFQAATEALRAGRQRVPARLRMLQAVARAMESEHQGPGYGAAIDRAGFAQFARLVWFRQPTLVMRYLLERTRLLARSHPEEALRVIVHLILLGGHLTTPASFADLTTQEASYLDRMRGQCWELRAQINADLQRGDDAVNAYLEAARRYSIRLYRAPQGVALVRAALVALACTPTDTHREIEQLELLLRGLRMLEYDRGLLRTQRYRFALVEDRDQLYREVFAALSTNIRHEEQRAAEIALWLMESLHRSATSATIRRGLDTAGAPQLRQLRTRYEEVEAGLAQQIGGALDAAALQTEEQSGEDVNEGPGAAEAWANLREEITAEFSRRLADALVPDPVDLADIARRLDGRVALYYRCERRQEGWLITTVMLLPDGPRMVQTVLASPTPGADDDSPRLNPAVLLDQLHSADHGLVATIHRTAFLGARVWKKLAQALLPPEFQALLQGRTTDARPAIIVVVPDGPLAAVPFAGLPLNDGTALVERAVTVFMPNLDMLAPVPERRIEGRDSTRILVNIGQPGFEETFARARAEDSQPGRLLVTATTNREEFVTGLGGLQRDDVALVFNHGLLSSTTVDQHVQMNDGRILSTTTAWNLAWPRTVILGSCWSSHVAVSTSAEPLAMATACLLGGAEHVLGAQAPAYTRETGQLLAAVTVSTAQGHHPALALREAALASRASGNAWPPPAFWANLVVWTTQPPAAEPGELVDERRWWTSRDLPLERGAALFSTEGVPRTDELLRPRPASTPQSNMPPFGPTLRAALKQARSSHGDVPLTSMEFFTAVLATDTVDWTSFLRAAGLGSPPQSSPRDDGSMAQGTKLIWGDGLSVELNVALTLSMRIGQRLRIARGNSKLEPAHIVYGLIEHQDNAVAKWLASGSSSTTAELRDLLAQQVLPTTIPPAAQLPPLPKQPKAKPEPVPVGVFRLHHRITADAELLRVVSQAAADETGVLTTLGFARTALRTDLSLARDLRIQAETEPLNARDAERLPAARSGRGLRLSEDLTLTASPHLIRATELAQRLCLHQRTGRLTTRHLTAALIGVDDSDGAAELRKRSPVPLETYPVALDALFPAIDVKDPLKESYRESEVINPVADIIALVLIGAALGIRWCARKVGRFALGICILLALGTTAALHSAGTAEANTDLLARQGYTIDGTVRTTDGSGYPAVLVGQLSGFYVGPAVEGIVNSVKSSTRGVPAALHDEYVFAVPAIRAGTPASGNVVLTYKGRTTQASLHCDGIARSLFCLAEVKLTGAASPGSFRWNNATVVLSASHPKASALLLQRSGPQLAVDAATVKALAPAQVGATAWLTVTDDNNYAIGGLEPVILNGKSHLLPILGFAEAAPAKTRTEVFPYSVFASYATALAESHTGFVQGAVAAIGAVVAQNPMPSGPPLLTLSPEIASPADLGGVRDNDIVVSLDGRDVDSSAAFVTAVRSHKPGSTISLTVSRSGKIVHLRIRLGYVGG